MVDKRITGAALLQIRRATPFTDFEQVREIRAYPCAGNAIPVKGGFVSSPKSAATTNPWIMSLGEFDYSLEKKRVALASTVTSDLARRPASLVTKRAQKSSSDRNADWNSFCALVTNSFIPPLDDDENRRPYASAGGLYPVQVFLLFRQTNKWCRYHLLPLSRYFEDMGDIPFDNVYSYVGADGLIDLNRIDFIIGYGVIPELCISKYRLRGYKFALMEIGQMIQQSSLVAASMGYRTRAYAYYDEISASELWNLNADDIWIEQLQVFARL